MKFLHLWRVTWMYVAHDAACRVTRRKKRRA